MSEDLEKKIEEKDLLSLIREGHIEVINVKTAHNKYSREDFVNAFVVGLLCTSLKHNGKNIELSKWYFGLARDLSQGKEIEYFGVKI